MPISEELLQRIRDNDPTLTDLNLTGNEIGSTGATAIATALENNITLKSLDLGWNEIGNEGATAIAIALENNTTLRGLYLWYNQIGNEGATAMATALKNNTTLTDLNLGANQIGNEGVQVLATAIENNSTLTYLGLMGNLTETEENAAINTIYAIIEGNTIIPQIIVIMSKIISGNLEEKFSIPQIRFISDSSCPRNCVKILENLVKDLSNEDIPDALQTVQDIKGAVGATILFTAIKAQESDLSQNKLHLPKDKLKLIIDALIDTKLQSFFKAKGVTKEGVKDDLRDKSGKIPLNTATENYILEYLKIDDIEETPSTTVSTSGERTINLGNSVPNPKRCCNIS